MKKRKKKKNLFYHHCLSITDIFDARFDVEFVERLFSMRRYHAYRTKTRNFLPVYAKLSDAVRTCNTHFRADFTCEHDSCHVTHLTASFGG